MENTQIQVTMTLSQWNAVIQGLAHRPYAEVFQVIEEIRKQGEAVVKQQSVDAKVE